MRQTALVLFLILLLTTTPFVSVAASSNQGPSTASLAGPGDDLGLEDAADDDDSFELTFYEDSDYPEAVSWKEIKPLTGATLVGFDGDSYLDDYSYMAAVPASVFSHRDKLYSQPVLFLDEEHDIRVLNSRQGVDYFMEDWMSINNGSLEYITYINVDEELRGSVPSSWNASKENSISGKNPFTTAADIAETSWKYSDEAVVAVIAENPSTNRETESGSLTGTVEGKPLQHHHFEGQKDPNPVDLNTHNFDVEEGYGYIDAFLQWTWLGQTIAPDGSTVTERGKDLDMQLYDSRLGEVVASEFWNVIEGDPYHPDQGPYEVCQTYVYNHGEWSATVSYMPTKGVGNQLETLFATAYYDIDIDVYPGQVFVLPDETPYGAVDAEFTLSWEGGSELGLIILTPSGAELAKSVDPSGGNSRTLSIGELGEGQYSVCVVNIGNDPDSDANFDISYSWERKGSLKDDNGFSSAANGAVLASMKNIPLLYAKSGSLPGATKDALDLLGVEKVYLMDLGGKGKVKDDIEDSRSLLQKKIEVESFTSFKSAYQEIQGISGQNDIIFSTINPWDQWFPEDPVTSNIEVEKALYIGPAALAGAFHGAPVLVTDLHPRLSAPQSWHNQFWYDAYAARLPPSVASMFLTGTSVYDYLEENGLDGEGKESILTIAGQFEMGVSWDRMLVGVANPGRMIGSPVDTSYWVARAGLYPALIFANPGLNQDIDPHDGQRWTGSHSESTGGPEPVVTQQETEETYELPYLQSWVSYQHRFNEQASEYWGARYVGPAGLSPYWSESDNPIDEGNSEHPDAHGSGTYYPDMTTSEVVPFYVDKMGAESVFTTNFGRTMENLNRGVLMWAEVMHGGHQSYGDGSGIVGFWRDEPEPDRWPWAPLEKNPWRGYESGGGTDGIFGPDTQTMSKYAGADVLPAYGTDATGEAYEYHDGVIIAIAQQRPQTIYMSGYDFNDALENIHSVGFNAGSCLIANTYLHLTMVRHGSSFQVIDPWLTSWYVAFAIELFFRSLALGATVGEAYAEGIHHVGIEYLTQQWWWDIFENVVYYGDPDMRMYSGVQNWPQPESVSVQDISGGHAPGGTTDHPHEITSTRAYEIGLFALIAVAGVAGVVFIKKKKEIKVAERVEE